MAMPTLSTARPGTRVYSMFGTPRKYGAIQEWITPRFCTVRWDKAGAELIARDQLYILEAGHHHYTGE